MELAIDLYTVTLKRDPNNTSVYNNLGSIFNSLGDNKKVVDCYKKVLAINHNDVDAHYNLGVIFNKLGENENAIIHYEKAIEIDSNFASARSNLGNVFSELGENEKAIICYEKAIEIDSNFASAHSNLGNVFSDLGEKNKAINCYEKAIAINPALKDPYNNLAIAFKESGESEKAINCYLKAIEIDPNYAEAVNGLSSLLKLTELPRNDYSKNIFLLLFSRNDVNHTELFHSAKLYLLTDENYNQLEKIILSDFLLLENKIIQIFLKEELLLLMLQKTLIGDRILEKVFTRLRSEIFTLLTQTKKFISPKYDNFIISLAEQCWLNEYIMVTTQDEIKKINLLRHKIESNDNINELDVAILACYEPLNNSKIITKKLLDYKSTNILFNDLTKIQINEPLDEEVVIRSFKPSDNIIDSVSKNVRDQYEENPYPRWRYTYKIQPIDFFDALKLEIVPNKVERDNKFINPNILVAGCGTGHHPILSSRFKNANLLAVDLSLKSLAFAKRKTFELGIKNIDFLHEDILQLKKQNINFDIIESVGTLHHMKYPIEGLKVLLDILKPNGFMKLGLYSKIARQHIVIIKDFIKQKNLKNTNEDIKIIRQLIFNEKENSNFQKIILDMDFYSTSSARDLLFHAQEHRFSIQEISTILKDLNLEFLGFNFLDLSVKDKYLKIFPNDKKNVSLDNWDQFETNNPATFLNMYQFWVRKK